MNVFYRSNGQRQRKAVLAQSGDRQRSGKRRLREGKRTAANRHSALRKCRNAVSAGVLSPISSAVGRNGAVGDKRNACAGARNYPRRRQILRLCRCAATPHPPPSGAPVSLRVGRSAGLTRHRRVIQHREPIKGKAWGGAPLSNTDSSKGRLIGVRRQERKISAVAEASGRVSLRAGERRHSPFD